MSTLSYRAAAPAVSAESQTVRDRAALYLAEHWPAAPAAAPAAAAAVTPSLLSTSSNSNPGTFSTLIGLSQTAHRSPRTTADAAPAATVLAAKKKKKQPQQKRKREPSPEPSPPPKTRNVKKEATRVLDRASKQAKYFTPPVSSLKGNLRHNLENPEGLSAGDDAPSVYDSDDERVRSSDVEDDDDDDDDDDEASDDDSDDVSNDDADADKENADSPEAPPVAYAEVAPSAVIVPHTSMPAMYREHVPNNSLAHVAFPENETECLTECADVVKYHMIAKTNSNSTQAYRNWAWQLEWNHPLSGSVPTQKEVNRRFEYVVGALWAPYLCLGDPD